MVCLQDTDTNIEQALDNRIDIEELKQITDRLFSVDIFV